MTVIHRDCGFVFFKARKTAGTSIEIHLICNSILGGDIYRTSTEIGRYGLRPRRRDLCLRLLNRRLFVNHPAGRFEHALPAWAGAEWLVRQHDPARRVRGMLGRTFWDNSLKVCSVRNPWDALLSYWRWQRRGRGGRSQPIQTPFVEWARAAMRGEPERRKAAEAIDARRLLHDAIFIDGEPVVDFMIRFEDLNGSLASLSRELGVSIPPLSIREKNSPTIDYRSFYTEELAAEVHAFFVDYIELTGYRFDDVLQQNACRLASPLMVTAKKRGGHGTGAENARC